MYLEYFGLTESPFSIAPNPRYLYMSERHREALAHLVYGLGSEGAFILLTGDVGTGKTTVSRCMLEQIPEDTKIALVLNPKMSAVELLETICDELYGQYKSPFLDVANSKSSIKLFIDVINRYLLEAHAQGRKTVIMIEEAQNLSMDVLEQLRLLTNLETNEHKLLQIILLGQPELQDLLDRPELSQLSQRITARYHLTPLNEEELSSYVSHRLMVAGCRQTLFNQKVLKRLYQLTHGVPRLVNVLCDRAMLGAYVQNKSQVDVTTLNNAAKEVFGKRASPDNNKQKSTGLWLAASAAMLLMVSVIAYQLIQAQKPPIENVKELSVEPSAEVQELTEIDEKEIVKKQTGDVATVSGVINWPADAARLRSNSLAYQSVFQQWQLNYVPRENGSPCFYAQTKGMACYEDKSNLEKIRALNRPVVLKLHDNHNQTYYAALLGLGQNMASMVIAGTEQKVAIEEIYKHWNGEFTLLWHQPPAYKKPIVPGDEGDDVFWLSQKLNQIGQDDSAVVTTRYQQDLVEKVKRFQLAQGLVADGIVGVHTLVRLNSTLGMNAPVLLNRENSDKS